MQRHGEARQDIVPREFCIRPEHTHVVAAAVDGGAPAYGIDDPDEAGTVLEPTQGLLVDFAVGVVRRRDLDGEVRWAGEVTCRDLAR